MIEKRDEKFSIVYFDFNIHHGPGMDYALRTSKFPYLLIMDSDCWPVKPNLLVDMWKLMENNIYGVGLVTQKKELKAYCMLLNKKMYLKYPKFVFHGSPLKDSLKKISKLGISDKILKNIKINEYTNWSAVNPGRGTRKRYGSDWYIKRKKEIPVNKTSLKYIDLKSKKNILQRNITKSSGRNKLIINKRRRK